VGVFCRDPPNQGTNGLDGLGRIFRQVGGDRNVGDLAIVGEPDGARVSSDNRCATHVRQLMRDTVRHNLGSRLSAAERLSWPMSGLVAHPGTVMVLSGFST
jgi:hypothetical protein